MSENDATTDLMNVYRHLLRATSRALVCPVLCQQKMAAAKSGEVTTLANTALMMENVSTLESARMVCAPACHHKEK